MQTNPLIFSQSLLNQPRYSLKMVFWYLLYISTYLVLSTAQNCSNCVPSRASYYPGSEEYGSDHGACGFGSFGATINDGDVTAVSSLYRDGVGCGACYQVICKNSYYCSDNGVTVVITDQGSGDDTDFILSKHAFRAMARTTDAAGYLLSLGLVDVEYRRVSCSYPGKNITIKIEETSTFPSYLAFTIYYQQGQRDITAVQLCETQSFTCKLLQRDHGAVWTSTPPPSGPLSIRMLFSDEDGDGSDDTWVVPINNIPQDWKPGAIYDSGVQVN